MARFPSPFPRAFKVTDPFFLQWHLTDRCNLSCRHCYRETLREERDLGAAKVLFRSFREFLQRRPQSRTRIQIAGGEPLLSPLLFPVLEMARASGVPTRVLSNGSLIGPSEAAALARCECRIVQLSLDGTPETHDALRGNGSYDAVLRAAGHLRAAGVQVTFALTLHAENRRELGAVLETAARFADRFAFSRFVPCGAGESLREGLLSPEQMKSAFEEVWRARSRFPALDLPARDPLWTLFYRHQQPSCLAGGCSAGYSGLCLEADGTLLACRRLPIPLGNGLVEDWEALWQSPLMQRLRNRDALKGSCGRCLLRWRCGGCRAIAHAVSKNPLGEDPQCFYRPTFRENLIQGARLLLENVFRLESEGGA